MLKKFLIAGAAGALMASTALAQTPATPPAADTPAATPPAASSTAPAASAPAASSTTASASSAKFVTSQTSEQWLGTKFKGTDVIGSDDKKIGDVGDVVFDKSGKIIAVVVGVGGFLGIGQKDVALDMAAFQVVPASTGSAAAPGSATTASASDPNDVKLKLSMTKEELTNAPAFEYYKAAPRTAGSATGGGTTGSAPRPATPTR